MLPNAPLRIRYPFKSLWAVAVDLAIGISAGGDAAWIFPSAEFIRGDQLFTMFITNCPSITLGTFAVDFAVTRSAAGDATGIIPGTEFVRRDQFFAMGLVRRPSIPVGTPALISSIGFSKRNTAWPVLLTPLPGKVMLGNTCRVIKIPS